MTLVKFLPPGLPPAGGSAGEVLKKSTGDDYDYDWAPDNTGGGGGSWGTITGTLTDQVDLDTALGGKAATVHTHAQGDVTSLVSDLAAKAPTARSIATSAPLTGGGDLSADRTLAVSAATTAAVGVVELATDGETAANVVVQGSDARLANARTPTAHAATHSSGSSDPITHNNLAGLTTGDPHTQYQQESERAAANGYASLDAGTKVPIAQIPTGATGTTVPFGNDARFTDARTPTAHATSHKSGGGDAIKLDELAATTDVTTLDASTTAHGLLAKLPNDAAKFMNGVGSWAVPGGGSDPWTYLTLGSVFATTSATAVDVTGLGFAPAANTKYEFEARLMLRTATATVNPRVGLAWPTGMTDGAASIHESQSATTEIQAHGNPNAALLIAVGGLANNTQSWPARVCGVAVAGATPSGNIRLQLASETAGTSVSIIAGSFLRYRTVA